MTGAVVTKEKTEPVTKVEKKEPSPISSLQREMNRLFEDFGRGFAFAQPIKFFETGGEFRAKVDMKDNEKEIVVTAELPGVELKDVEVAFSDSGLVIKGEKKIEKEEKEKGYYKMERSYGSFYRLLPLPCAVEHENIAATYKDGVLKVTLPKTKEALKSEHKVTVKAG